MHSDQDASAYAGDRHVGGEDSPCGVAVACSRKGFSYEVEAGAPLCRIADRDEAWASLHTYDAEEEVDIAAHPCFLYCKAPGDEL